MSAATKAAVTNAQQTIDPDVRIYIPSTVEAATLARWENIHVRETVKLAALRRRRCVRQRTGEVLSVAVEKAARDLDKATTNAAGSNDLVCSITEYIGVARDNLDLARRTCVYSTRAVREPPPKPGVFNTSSSRRF